MKTGRPKKPLILTDEARQDLEAIATSRSMPHRLVQRARIVLLAANGEMNKAIAKKMGLTKPAVGTWRQRYIDYGLEGLHDELRPGRPRTISDERVANVI